MHANNENCEGQKQLGEGIAGHMLAVKAGQELTLTARYKAYANSVYVFTTFTFRPKEGESYMIRKGGECGNDCMDISLNDGSGPIPFQVRNQSIGKTNFTCATKR